MLVVSDSSPLNFLVQMQRAEVLPALFERVLIPHAVVGELSRPSTPEAVRAFVLHPPAWLVIQDPQTVERIARLHAGEEAAISLAREVRADLVLIDDGAARKAASARGLAVIGLIGLLERAGERGLLDLAQVVPQLPEDYRIDPAIIRHALARWAKRKAE